VKSRLILKSIFFATIFFSVAASFPAQEKSASPSPTPAVKVMGENERLSFMRSEEGQDKEAPTSGGLFLKTLGAMMLIVGLVFFGAWTLKKFGFGSGGSANAGESPELTILSSVSPGSGRTISVVKFGTRTLLIGSTTQTFTLLADEAGSEFEFTSEPTPRSVADLLAEEKASFNEELSRANDRLRLQDQFGGQA